MKHKVKKIKIHGGQDSNQMLMKKMVRNFVATGATVLPVARAKYVRQTVESLAHKALNYSQSAKNILLPYFMTEKKVLAFVEMVKTHTKGTASGSIKLVKLPQRLSDAAPVTRVEWTHAAPDVVPTQKSRAESTKELKESKPKKVIESKLETSEK